MKDQIKEQIRTTLQQGEIRAAMELLKSVHNESALLLLADYDNELSWQKVSSKGDESWQAYTDELVLRIGELLEEEPAGSLDSQRPGPGAGKERTDETRVFISYNSEDVEIAKRMHAYLNRWEIKVFFDRVDMRLGECIVKRVSQEILEQHFFVVLISKNSLRSPWVCLETSIAGLKLMGTDRLIPVVLDGSLHSEDYLEEVRAYIRKEADRFHEKVKEDVLHRNWEEDHHKNWLRWDNFCRQFGSVISEYQERDHGNIPLEGFELVMERLMQRIGARVN